MKEIVLIILSICILGVMWEENVGISRLESQVIAARQDIAVTHGHIERIERMVKGATSE